MRVPTLNELTREAPPLVLALAGVAAIWLARETPRAPGLMLDAEAGEPRPTAERPASSLRIDAGNPQGSWAMGPGFEPPVVVDGARMAKIAGERAELHVPLAPDPHGFHLTVLGRAPAGAKRQEVDIAFNDKVAGTLLFGEALALRAVDVPADFVLAGRNLIELVLKRAAGGLLIDRVWLDARSIRADIDLGTAAARPLLDKFDEAHAFQGRNVAFPANGGGRISVPLRPYPEDYALAVVASAPVSAFTNHVGVGTLPARDFVPQFTRVPRSALHVGNNLVELTASAGERAAVDRIGLEPIGASVLLDFGAGHDRSHCVAGFSVDEACDVGTCVWSDAKTSRLALWMGPQPGSYTLSFRAHTLAPLAPLATSITLNGRALGSQYIGPDFQTFTVEVPHGTLVDGENVLEFGYAATVKPATFVAGSKDQRDLAVSFDWLTLERAVNSTQR
jgi:hypothetical protein